MFFGISISTGPGRPGLRDVKSLLHNPRQIVDVRDEVIVLHDRRGHAKHVRLLKRALADHMLRHLPGNRHQRRAIEERIRNARHQVHRARPARRHHHAGPAGHARKPLRRKHAALLVPGQNRANLLRPRQRLVHRHRRPARIRKNRRHPLALQRLDQNIRPQHNRPKLALGGWRSGFLGCFGRGLRAHGS